jgi:hypothetical protein
MQAMIPAVGVGHNNGLRSITLNEESYNNFCVVKHGHFTDFYDLKDN